MGHDTMIEEGRVALADVGDDRVRIVIDRDVVGPVLTRRAAKVVRRWLEGGAVHDLEHGRPHGVGKIVGVLSAVDDAVDKLGDVLRNGLR